MSVFIHIVSMRTRLFILCTICIAEIILIATQLWAHGDIPWMQSPYGSWPVTAIMALPLLFTVLHSGWTLSWRRAVPLLLGAASVGFFFEELGLKYETVFGGAYSYQTSGIFIGNVPLLVILYWPVFIYLAYCITNVVVRWKFLPLMVVADGLIAVSIDLFLDPIQVSAGSWQWLGGGWYFGIPIGNFIGWFVVTALVTGTFRSVEAFTNHRAPNPVHPLWRALPVGGYALLILSLVALALLDHQSTRPSTILINGTPLAITRAVTVAQRQQGLSNREHLAPNHGMLFVFDTPDRHGIWMKDMRFPIDILWLDPNGTVVDLQSNVSPETYPTVFTPKMPAQYVLELPAGFSQNHDVRIGTTIKDKKAVK